MGSLGEELALRIGATQRSLEGEGAVPLGGTMALIKRKRAVRQAATAGIAAVTAATVAGIGTATAHRLQDAQPAAYYLPPGDGAAHIPVDRPSPTTPDVGLQCGDPAPEPMPVNDGFRLEVEASPMDFSGASFAYLSGTATVWNENEEHFPGYVADPHVVFVRDGVVAGLQPSAGVTSRLFFTPGRDNLVTYVQVTPWAACAEDASMSLLEPGDYDVYLVSTVMDSPEVAALSGISGSYGSPPHFDGDTWLEPIDWECLHAISPGLTALGATRQLPNASAACLPAQNPHATWDAESRSIVLPYKGTQVTRVFQSVLVSEPIPFTVEPPSDDPLAGFEPTFRDAPPTDADAYCGADLGWSADDVVSWAEFHSPTLSAKALREDPRQEAVVWAAFGPRHIEGRTATVTVPERVRVYISRQSDVYSEELDRWLWLNEVIGSGWVTFDREEYSLSRALGPTAATVDFSEVTWCPGVDHSGEVTVTAVGDITVRGGGVDQTRPMFSIRAGWVS